MFSEYLMDRSKHLKLADKIKMKLDQIYSLDKSIYLVIADDRVRVHSAAKVLDKVCEVVKDIIRQTADGLTYTESQINDQKKIEFIGLQFPAIKA